MLIELSVPELELQSLHLGLQGFYLLVVENLLHVSTISSQLMKSS
jgi:hypothetical protein